MTNKNRRDFLKMTAGGAGGIMTGNLFAQGRGGGPGGGQGHGQGNGPGPNAGPGNASGEPVPVDPENPSIVFHEELCENCDHCEKSCGRTMGIIEKRAARPEEEGASICVHCGQCSALCPHDAITERFQYPAVRRLLEDPDRFVVALIAPSIRVSLGERFGLPQGANVEGKTVAALKQLGFDRVFDVTFGADLTVMEEVSELIRRIQGKAETGPMFTSCCPAWVQMAEFWYPELLPNLSSTKSPILMQGALVKTWFAQKEGIDPAKITVVAFAPCTAKKFEIARPEMNSAGRFLERPEIRDVDVALTTRELGRLIYEGGIRFDSLDDAPFDSMMGRGSAGGEIFGNTGGVMEAALRTAYPMMTGKDAPADLFSFTPIRGLDAVREATVVMGDVTLRVAAVHGGANVFAFMDKVKSGEVKYDFIEVMACPGGCIGGGGQPKVHGRAAFQTVRENRSAGLYQVAETVSERSSDANPEVKTAYNEFLRKEKDGQSAAELLLHTAYQARFEK